MPAPVSHVSVCTATRLERRTHRFQRKVISLTSKESDRKTSTHSIG